MMNTSDDLMALKSVASDQQQAAGDAPSSPSVAASPHWQVAAKRDSKGFSPLVAFCFTINYILGTGFLTIPWAFTQGGLALSAILLALVGLCADVSKNYLLETMARAEAMLDLKFHWIRRLPGEEDKPMFVYSPMISMTPMGGSDERDGLIASATAVGGDTDQVGRGIMQYKSMDVPQGGGALLKPSSVPGTPQFLSSLPGTPSASQPGTPGHGRRLLKRTKPKYIVRDRKFEVNTLCRVFLGKTGLNLYTFFICLYIYCTLWAYTSVFSSAMARAVPILSERDEYWNYTIYAVVFAAMVVPMSCLELHEQVVLQVFLTGCRFVMLFLMLATSAGCASETLHPPNDDDGDEATSGGQGKWFRPQGIHKMLPIIVFAHIYHHSIPGLSHPVRDKRKLGPVFQSTCVFSTIAYTLIGVVLGAAFGIAGIEQSSNLNWKGYHGGTGELDDDGVWINVAWWARAISFYIILFPACDVVSAFPLNAITLGNNMMGWFFGRKIHEYEDNRFIRTQFRLLAACPPILLGVWMRELGKITDYAGTTGFVIGFSFPALLYLRSKRVAARKHFRTNTFYESYASSNVIAWILFAFGIVMLIYVSICLAIGD